MERLYLGSCSWKYPSWAGLVYSGPSPADFLAEYASKYDSVEIDQWFWSLFKGKPPVLPRRELAASYASSVPEHFRFTVKCPNALTLTETHVQGGRAGSPNPDFLDPGLFGRFLEAIEPILPKVGLFIFQFEYFNARKMPERAALLDRLGPFLEALPRGLPYGVELRNPRWLDPAWFSFLEERRAAPVFLQGYWMDDVAALYARIFGPRGPLGRAVPKTVCLRLHGEDRQGIEAEAGEDWSRILRDRDEELPPLMAVVRDLLGRGSTVFINVNNHYEGSAPITIDKINRLLTAGP
ncbi:MAG TPA: DUF72 domain-containing protein [Rectinemataceae bacterium]|nr:DUF72 domain-containing protein [Rectinemataceae bacterium]